MRKLICLVFLFASFASNATDPYPKNEGIDVQHYRFQLELNDSTNIISGHATLILLIKKVISEFELDLTNQNSKGEGMQVNQILLNGSPLQFAHQNDRIKIILPTVSVPGQSLEIILDYGGIPLDGLIISKNKFGDRTFFGDNWPNRGHQWLPCVDHPSDKATCEFIVIAPQHYTVIANGKKVEEKSLKKNQKMTRWEERIDIPIKVMVIGVAHFAIQEAGRVGNIAVESWVYPQNRDAGFSDYACATKILDFFQNHVGPYSYEKLANVQSTTRYGGMENASNIFYSENSVDGKNDHQELIAHEIAHQWFGNSVTEMDWHHVWLSEGFATYFSHLYMESAYGHDRLVEEIAADRDQVLGYFNINSGPVIDTLVTDLMKLLNAHSYQKGSWVLHMLRREMGDLQFWKGIQNYYQAYRNGNALTGDFQHIMEEVSRKDLTPFFRQWLWKGSHPKISGYWKYDPKSKSVKVTINQVQAGPVFSTPLDIGLRLPDGSLPIHTVKLEGKSQQFSLQARNRPLELVLDPKTWLLFEGQIEAQ